MLRVHGNAWLNRCRERVAVHRPVDLLAIGKVDGLAVGGPARFGSTSLGICEQLHACAVGIHGEDLVIRVAIGTENDLRSVG